MPVAEFSGATASGMSGTATDIASLRDAVEKKAGWMLPTLRPDGTPKFGVWSCITWKFEMWVRSVKLHHVEV